VTKIVDVCPDQKHTQQNACRSLRQDLAALQVNIHHARICVVLINSPMALQGGALQEQFLAFCKYGSKNSETQLDGRSFVKVFRDTGLLKKPLTQTDLDLIFAKVTTMSAFITAAPLQRRTMCAHSAPSSA